MPSIPLGLNAYARPEGHLPEVRVVNLLLEKDPTNLVDGVTRLQRPGLTSFVNVGASPIRGIYRSPGVFNGDFLVVGAQTLFRVTLAGAITTLGTIPGDGLVDIAAGSDIETSMRAIIVSSAGAFSTDGNTVTQIVMPDGEYLSCVVYIAGYFLLGVAGSHHIFWLAPGDVNPDALNFFSVETRPGSMIAAMTISDALYLWNESCTEVWYPSGNNLAPFTRQQGQVFDKGNASRDATVPLDNGAFWVGLDGIVYRTTPGPPQRVSNHGIEARIRKSDLTQLKAWPVTLDGHSLYVLTIQGQGTFACDIESSTWSEFKTYGRTGWQAHLGAQAPGQMIVGGDDTTADLWLLDWTASTDALQPMERIITGGVPLSGRPKRCNMLELEAPTGFSMGPQPMRVQICWSDDGGATYDDWQTVSLGAQGGYGENVILRQCGMIASPGRVFQVRCTDPTIFRLSGMTMNGGGEWAR